MSVVPHPPPHRVIRAALFAVVCVGVAAMLHNVADGCKPTWSELGFGLPAVWLAAWPALGRERSGLELTAVLGAAQVGLHYLFTYVYAVGDAPYTAAPPMSAMPYMPGMPGMNMSPVSTHPSGIAMFAAHALAVVICGWWLRQGERDFFALCRAVAALAATSLYRLTDAIAALYALARLGAERDVSRPAYGLPSDGLRHRRTALLTSVTFRGPPVLT